MVFKIVGADENSDFPARVETRLAEKFWTTDTPLPKGDKGDKGDPGEPGADGADGEDGAPGPKGDSGEDGSGIIEDPSDPGFFI